MKSETTLEEMDEEVAGIFNAIDQKQRDGFKRDDLRLIVTERFKRQLFAYCDQFVTHWYNKRDAVRAQFLGIPIEVDERVTKDWTIGFVIKGKPWI